MNTYIIKKRQAAGSEYCSREHFRHIPDRLQIALFISICVIPESINFCCRAWFVHSLNKEPVS